MNCEHVEELLSAYLDNELAPEESRAVAAHLQGCSDCSNVLSAFRRGDFLLSQLPRVSPGPALRDRIFSSPEYLELTGTFDVNNPEHNPYRHPRIDPTRRPHLIALPGGRSSQGGLLSGTHASALQPTRKQPATQPRRKGSMFLRAMFVAIAATILLTIGIGSFISWHLMQPGGQSASGIIPPPASLPSGPLSAGMHLAFLRDGKLMSIPADGSTGTVALTPAGVTVASNWAISAPLPGHAAGDLLAYIDLQTATLHTIRSDGLSDKVIPQRLLKAGIQPSSVWDTDTGADILSSLAWSPASNNSMLAFVADPDGNGLTNLYIYSTGTGSVQMVPLPFKGSAAHPVWSPDGIRIAFAFTHNGATSILDYNTENQGLLTITNGSQQQPGTGDSVLSFDWSPDTDVPAITWSYGAPGHVHSIWTKRVGASSDVAPRLIAQGDYTEAQYSRNGHGGVGSWLLVGSPNGRTSDLWRADVEGVSPVQLTSGQQINYAVWSPDGMTAYYLNAVSAGIGALHAVRMATGADTQIATGVAAQPAPAWSFDSQELAYSTGTQMMAVNLQAGQKPLTLNLHGPASAFTWSATSAHQLVVVLGDGQEGIFLVDTQHNTSRQVDKKGVTGPITWSEVP